MAYFLWRSANGFRVWCASTVSAPGFFDSAFCRGFQMRYLSILLTLIVMTFSAQSAMAEKRVAFVVGNGAYKNVAQLPNPPIDAKAMAAVLRNSGFGVVECSNLTRDA